METNGEILSYSITIINLKDGSTIRNEMIPADVKNITERSLGTFYVNNLSCFRDLSSAAGVPYNVSIAAVNRAGPGEFTVFIHFTRELAPNIAPRDVTISRSSPTVMVVSWIPLIYSEARGFISHYTVAYTPLTSNRRKRQALVTMTVTVPGMGANTTRIEGLDPNTDYTVLISATNGAGRNDLSHPVLVTSPNCRC